MTGLLLPAVIKIASEAERVFKMVANLEFLSNFNDAKKRCPFYYVYEMN